MLLLTVFFQSFALCAFTGVGFKARPSWRGFFFGFSLIPKAVSGSCNRNQLRSVGKEERKELSCQTEFAELCPAVQGLGEGRRQWGGGGGDF